MNIKIGEENKCRQCGRKIVWLGKYWSHVEGTWRHIAKPTDAYGENSAGEAMLIETNAVRLKIDSFEFAYEGGDPQKNVIKFDGKDVAQMVTRVVIEVDYETGAKVTLETIP